MDGCDAPTKLPLGASTAILALLADVTRVRLLALLDEEELSVAELVQVTELGQSRVSTHLGRLREAGLVAQRRAGASTFYRRNAAMPPPARAIWQLVASQLADPQLRTDRARLDALVRAREQAWPDTVAGQMERHYSPGRTWEATARGLLGMARLGDVLDAGSGDGTLAALIAPRAESVTCVDRSERVIEAARRRLSAHENVTFAVGDLCRLPFEAEAFDHVMLFNVLTYVDAPAQAIAEAARVSRPGGHLAVVTLAAHDHASVTTRYGHVTAGFEPAALDGWMTDAGLTVERCEVTSRERRAPKFEVISAFARKDSVEA